MESRQVYSRRKLHKINRVHKTKGPVPFRPTQRDYNVQEKLVSVDSLSKITFDDGLLKMKPTSTFRAMDLTLSGEARSRNA